MKKILLVSLAICAVFVFFGCNEAKDGPVTISFDLYYNGAPAAPDKITINSNEQIGSRLPPAPAEPDGLIFLGWYRHTAGGKWQKVGPSDTFPFSTTLYARWQGYWYITFNLNYLFAPESPARITLFTDEQIGDKLPPDPDPTKRTGFTFLGWFNSPTGGTKVTANDMFYANTILYAQWQDNRDDITISFNLNYDDTTDTPPESVQIKSGDMITYLNIPTVMRTGYWRLRGWSTERSGGALVERTTTFNSNTVLYAVWAQLVGFELDVKDYYKGTSAEEFYGGAFGVPAEYTIEQDGSLSGYFPDPNAFITNSNVPQGMFINLQPDQIAQILALPATTKLEVVLDATSVPSSVEFRYFVGANPKLGENWQATVATATGTLSAIANQTVSFSNANRANTTVCFFLQLRGQNLPAPIKVNIKSVLIRWEAN
jgi:uncharacterized repeat protein (TIGR02543 family)